MALSDYEITKRIQAGEIKVDIPESTEFDYEIKDNEKYILDQLEPASVDLRLGSSFKKIDSSNMPTAKELGIDELPDDQRIITMDREIEYKEIARDKPVIMPGEFIIANTVEYITVPDDLGANVEGRSSIARAGLLIECAGWIDPGFHGTITLEIFNFSNYPIRLDPGRRICQIVYDELDQPAIKPYGKDINDKYAGQIKAKGSKIYQDREVRSNF